MKLSILGKNIKFRNFSQNNSGQFIVLLGFIIVLAIIGLVIISANLSTVGTDITEIHSKSFLDEFENVKERLKPIHAAYFHKSGGGAGDMDTTFELALEQINEIELAHGFYVSGEIKNSGYAGNTLHGSIYSVNADITLTDGQISISDNFDYVVGVYNGIY